MSAVDSGSVTWLPTLMLYMYVRYICKNLLLLIFMKVEKFFGYLFNAHPDAVVEVDARVEAEAEAKVGKVSSGASECA